MPADQIHGREFPGRQPSTNHSYFYSPPAWIGTTPSDDELAKPVDDLIKVVCSRSLPVGIRIAAHRDGVFQFDFREWPDGHPVSIPPCTLEYGKPWPAHIAALMKKAQQHCYKCMAVMNAHLACMSTAMSKVQHHGIWIRQIVTPSSYFTTHWVNGERHIEGVDARYDPILAYVSANCSLEDDILKKRVRVAIALDTVEYSFDLLERILTSKIPDMLLMTTLIYFSAINYAQHDFPTALTLSWTVCEKLLQILWDGYLEDRTFEEDGSGNRTRVISSDRRRTLGGRDYTASVISEVLTLAGKLNNDIYVKLSKSRKARNGWLHDFAPISDIMAAQCIQTAQAFLKEVSGIELLVSLSHSSRL